MQIEVRNNSIGEVTICLTVRPVDHMMYKDQLKEVSKRMLADALASEVLDKITHAREDSRGNRKFETVYGTLKSNENLDVMRYGGACPGADVV